jgi:hypothetical protein
VIAGPLVVLTAVAAVRGAVACSSPRCPRPTTERRRSSRLAEASKTTDADGDAAPDAEADPHARTDRQAHTDTAPPQPTPRPAGDGR